VVALPSYITLTDANLTIDNPVIQSVHTLYITATDVEGLTVTKSMGVSIANTPP